MARVGLIPRREQEMNVNLETDIKTVFETRFVDKIY